MYTFSGVGGRIFCWGFFHREIFYGEGSFQGVNLSEKITHRGIFHKPYIKFYLNVSLSLFCLNFTRGIVKVIVRGKFSPGLNYLDEISVGREIFPRRWG